MADTLKIYLQKAISTVIAGKQPGTNQFKPVVTAFPDFYKKDIDVYGKISYPENTVQPFS